jgi:hypothetical protein
MDARANAIKLPKRRPSSVTSRAAPVESPTDLRARLLERSARGQLLVVGSEPQSEPIARKTRENVEMHVKHLLHRGLAVGQEEVDSLATEAAGADCGGNSLCFLHQTACGRRVEVGEIWSVTNRNHEHVTWIYGLNVHERGDLVVAKEERCRQLAG